MHPQCSGCPRTRNGFREVRLSPAIAAAKMHSPGRVDNHRPEVNGLNALGSQHTAISSTAE